jgi:YVTN family beta-propeller protein
MSRTVDPRPGTIVGGYRIESLIGRGGMSVVYLAEHLRLERKVALKLIAPDLAEDAKFEERFVRESKLAASLEHPNIVPIYDAAEADGVLFLSMRYVPGGDLRTLLQGGPLDPARTMSILAQTAGALDAAHAEGLIHRDVKPGNILITPRTDPEGRDRVYLSDFGLTKRATSDSGITATGQFVGTLDYAAPEQFEARPMDARADVYSLGGVLYECLTGEVPFPRENQAALVYAHLQSPPPRVTERRPDLPPAIDAVVATAMAKDPADRYSSAGALAAAAAEALGVTPVLPTTPSTPTGPMPTPPPRRRTGLLLGAGAAALAVVVLLVVLLNAGGEPPATGPSGAGPSTAPSAALTDYVARVDPDSGQVMARVEAGRDPVGVVVAEGSVWVANGGDDTLSRIDPVTERVEATIDVVKGPFAVAVGEGAVWVAGIDTSLSRIDPATNDVVPFDVGVRPESLAVGEGAVWVAYGLGSESPEVRIEQFDARTGQRVREVRVPGIIGAGVGAAFRWVMAAAGGSLWTGGDEGNLYRIDSVTGEVLSKKALGKPISDISATADSVWVGSNGTPGTVFAVDGQSGKVVDTIPGGGGRVGGPWHRPLHLAADEADVWVTDAMNGTISRIVILSGQASPAVDIGEVPTGVALGLGSVWVAVDGEPP